MRNLELECHKLTENRAVDDVRVGEADPDRVLFVLDRGDDEGHGLVAEDDVARLVQDHLEGEVPRRRLVRELALQVDVCPFHDQRGSWKRELEARLTAKYGFYS